MPQFKGRGRARRAPEFYEYFTERMFGAASVYVGNDKWAMARRSTRPGAARRIWGGQLRAADGATSSMLRTSQPIARMELGHDVGVKILAHDRLEYLMSSAAELVHVLHG